MHSFSFSLKYAVFFLGTCKQIAECGLEECKWNTSPTIRRKEHGVYTGFYVFFVLALADLTIRLPFVQKGAVAPAHLFHQTREAALEGAWLAHSAPGASGCWLSNKDALCLQYVVWQRRGLTWAAWRIGHYTKTLVRLSTLCRETAKIQTKPQSSHQYSLETHLAVILLVVQGKGYNQIFYPCLPHCPADLYLLNLKSYSNVLRPFLSTLPFSFFFFFISVHTLNSSV